MPETVKVALFADDVSLISSHHNKPAAEKELHIRLHHSLQPKFLGVTLDGLLTFGPHIQSISTKAATRCRVLGSFTSKEWGGRKGGENGLTPVIWDSLT